VQRSQDKGSPPKLLDEVRAALRRGHYSHLTEKAYIGWIRRFILFHDKRHPREMGSPEIQAFLSSLAVDRKVSASTQNQALNSLLFLYTRVLGIKLQWVSGVIRAKKPERIPVVLTVEEVQRVLLHLNGIYWLAAALMYGSGLRLMECVRLRVKDVDLSARRIVVRDGKGGRDRVTMLSDRIVPKLERYLEDARERHGALLKTGRGEVYLPYALAQKYRSAAREWRWQFLFPASRDVFLPSRGHEVRWHPEPISGRSRNCSATRTSARR
jgi:integron integrase